MSKYEAQTAGKLRILHYDSEVEMIIRGISNLETTIILPLGEILDFCKDNNYQVFRLLPEIKSGSKTLWQPVAKLEELIGLLTITQIYENNKKICVSGVNFDSKARVILNNGSQKVVYNKILDPAVKDVVVALKKESCIKAVRYCEKERCTKDAWFSPTNDKINEDYLLEVYRSGDIIKGLIK